MSPRDELERWWREPALPTDPDFCRAVLERILAIHSEEREVPYADRKGVAAMVLHRLVGALQAQLPQSEIEAFEERARAEGFEL